MLAPILLFFAPAFAADIALPKVFDDRLQIQLVAAEPEVVTPTGLTVDDKGRVLVIESHTHFRPEGYKGPPADRILLMDDFDPATGKARKISVFFEGTTYTMSLAVYHDGSLFVATRSEIFRLFDKDGDNKADGRTPICHLETAGNYPHNGLSGLAFDFAGNVYFGFGENLGADYKLIGSDGQTLSGGGEGGNIYCCNPEGKNLRRVATGFWNPFGLGFDAFGRLFAVDNDPDSRPPCRLLHIVEGGDYGYRFRNGRKGVHPFTAWNGELPGTLPMVAGTGEAPCAVLAYESDNLPDEYRGDLLVTSWGDHRLERYHLKPRGASFSAEMTPVLLGDENFRPVGLALAPDGSLFFSDWVDKSYPIHGKGRVWRLSAKSPPKRVAPNGDIGALTSLHGPIRDAAARRLARQVANRTQAFRLMMESRDERVQAAAARVLPFAGFYDQSLLFGLVASHPSSNVRFALVNRLRDATATGDFAADLGDRRWLPILAADNDLGSETLAQVFALPKLHSYPIAVLYQSFYNSHLNTAPLTDESRRRFWDAAAIDPFLMHGVSAALTADVKDWHSLIRRPPSELIRMDSTLIEERLAFAIGARRSGKVKPSELVPELLAAKDSRLQLVGLLWLAESDDPTVSSSYRGRVERVLQQSSITRQVFEVAVATLNRLDGRAVDSKNEPSGDVFLAKVLLDEKAPSSTRRFALRSLPPDNPSLNSTLLSALLSDADEAIRLEAIRTIRQRPDAERWPQLREIAANSDKALQERCEAILGLSPGNKDDRKLLFELASGSNSEVADEALRALRGFDLDGGEKQQLTDLAARLAGPHKELAERVLARNPPKDLPKPEDQAAWLARATGEGNPQAGERIFYHLRVGGCFRCHEFEGRGYQIGPDLTNIGRAMTRERLVQSIVDPSREIAPMFTNWSILTKDGQVKTGIHIGDEVDGRIKFADQNGRVFHVHPNDIDRRQPSNQSVMPAGLADNLTAQELRDLLAFLVGQSSRLSAP